MGGMIVSMKPVRPFGISGRVGLALLAAWPALAVGLSVTRGRFESILMVAIFWLPVALLGAIAWLRAGQRHPRVFFQKRLMVGIYAAIVTACLVSAFSHFQLPRQAAVCTCAD
jgi:predicted membrane protein